MVTTRTLVEAFSIGIFLILYQMNFVKRVRPLKAFRPCLVQHIIFDLGLQWSKNQTEGAGVGLTKLNPLCACQRAFDENDISGQTFFRSIPINKIITDLTPMSEKKGNEGLMKIGIHYSVFNTK